VPTSQTSTWMHSNRYSTDTACEHCNGVIRHETWCITRSRLIRYAYQAVLDSSHLSEGDGIILHALGVRWVNNICAGSCQSGKAAQR
jgi:hypothetical protein